MTCKCGTPLSLGTEKASGKCWLCADGVSLESTTETVGQLVKVWDSRPGPIKQAPLRRTVKRGASKGESVTPEESQQLANEVTETGNGIEVTESGNGKEVTETKQERYKRKNADKVKAADRERKRRG